MVQRGYRIRLRDGRLVVLKIAPPPDIEVMTYERGAMATELAALRLVAEQTAVPVPNVDFADQSHELCDADYFFMPFIEGENLGTLADITPYREALGVINRQLNEIRGLVRRSARPRRGDVAGLFSGED